MADDNIKDVGFAIVTLDEGTIEDNAQDSLGRELTKDEWEDITKDLSTQEYNALEFIKENIDDARDEGHGGHTGDELIGTAWYDDDDEKQRDFVMFREDSADYPDMNVGETILNKGLSKIGEEVLSDSIDIRFFDIPKEDIEAWEDDN